MLAEAVLAAFAAGKPAEMLTAAERANAALTDEASNRSRFMAETALGMALVLGGDAAAGAESHHRGIVLAAGAPELKDDLRLLPWLTFGPMFLRKAEVGRAALAHALHTARARAALGELAMVLLLLARDEATSDRWAVAEATYDEAIGLARETDQRTDLGLGLAGLAWLQARRGREEATRALAAEALQLSVEFGARLNEVWANAALGELELGLGDAARAARHFEDQRRLMSELGITDVDLSPAAELVDAYVRLGRWGDAELVAAQFMTAAEAKAQPWSLARALRCRALVAADDHHAEQFERALRLHAHTLDGFETARTQLAYGQRLRRARNRVLAREQLRSAVEAFERLDARPWTEQARTELAATGETLRRREPSTVDELTPQELQIAMLLAGGKTTREAAATLFLSPKTIEYHLRHVYQKLDIHSREELALSLATRPAQESERADYPLGGLA
jgi:DNA-binding NarL/FixJ family response regulator